MELSNEKIHSIESAITNLESSSSAIKGYSAIFQELADLQTLVKEETLKFQKTITTIESLSKTIEAGILNQQNTTIEKLSNISSYLEKQITQVKSTIRELDSSLVTRLDKNKSDISLDLRNEGAQIQRALETSLNSTINKLETVLLTGIEGQKKTIKIQSVAIFVLAFTMVASIAVPYFMNI
jgi:primosomal protein N'